jgi:hypothetical protein
MLKHFRIRYVVPIALVALAPLVFVTGTAQGASSHPAPPSGTCTPLTTFRAANFERSTRIDNRWLPLAPGIQLTLEGRANTAGTPVPHTVVFTVTDVVKVIDGVHTLVLWDRDISDGELAEEEITFFAQDKAGNVWNLGEYPEEFEDGRFAGAPSTWISGQRALGGIHMPANPQPGTPRYVQGYVPAIDFLDCAQVFATNQTTCVPVQCYTNVLVTDENSPLDNAAAHQRKYHAAGVGIVQIGAVNDPHGETLVLTSVRRLDERGMAEARSAALRLDRRGYVHGGGYRMTQPAMACVQLGAPRLMPGLLSGLACP